jgi:hypothetical protein
MPLPSVVNTHNPSEHCDLLIRQRIVTCQTIWAFSNADVRTLHLAFFRIHCVCSHHSVSLPNVETLSLFFQICKWTSKHLHKFLYSKTNQMHQFPKFTPAWNSTCFGQFLCPSSWVYSLYTRRWCMSYRFEDSFWAGPGWTYTSAVCTVNKLMTTGRGTCRVSCRSKFGKLVHLVGFIIKKFVTMQHGHMNVNIYINVWRMSDTKCALCHTRILRNLKNYAATWSFHSYVFSTNLQVFLWNNMVMKLRCSQP